MVEKRLVINSKLESILSSIDSGFDKYNTSAIFRKSIDSIVYGGSNSYMIISELCDIIDENNKLLMNRVL